MAKMVYARPSDNLSPISSGGVDWAVSSGTPDPDYPASNAGILDPSKPAGLLTTTGRLVRDLGSAKAVPVVAIPHHNITAGLEVRVKANASDSWGSPSLNQLITIPAAHEDGFSSSPFLDLSAIAHTYRFWAIEVVGTNGAPIKFGEIVLANVKRTLEINYSWGAKEGEDHPIVEHRTELGVSAIYDLGTKWRSFAGDVDTTDAGLASLRALARDARNRSRPFLVIPDPDINEAWLGRMLDTRFDFDQVFLNQKKLPIRFQEVSRGLAL